MDSKVGPPVAPTLFTKSRDFSFKSTETPISLPQARSVTWPLHKPLRPRAPVVMFHKTMVWCCSYQSPGQVFCHKAALSTVWRSPLSPFRSCFIPAMLRCLLIAGFDGLAGPLDCVAATGKKTKMAGFVVMLQGCPPEPSRFVKVGRTYARNVFARSTRHSRQARIVPR